MLRAHAADAFGSALSSQVTSWRGWWDGPTPLAALIALIAPLAPAAACSRLPGPDPPWEERLLVAIITSLIGVPCAPPEVVGDDPRVVDVFEPPEEDLFELHPAVMSATASAD